MKTKAIRTKQAQKKGDPNKATIICLATLSVVLLCITIFLYLKSPSGEERKKTEVFESLANIYLRDSFFIEGEQSTDGIEKIGISEDGDLYISFKVKQYENHVNIAERDFTYYFHCEKDRKECSMVGSAGEWIETPKEEQAKARKLIEELEKPNQ